jgi:transcriptional regulator with XRE-family HTH domain
MGIATIGSALKYRRGDLGIDQADAAARIGMSRTTFSSYERDLQRPSVEVLPALAQFLDVTLDEILDLYGATCIAALRPQLELLVSTTHDRPATDAAPDSASTLDGDSSARISEQREPSVSIFSKELSDGTTSPVITASAEPLPAEVEVSANVETVADTFAEPFPDEAEVPVSVTTDKKKKKKKKGKGSKK